MVPLLRYSVLRLGLFVLVLGVLVLLQAGPILALVLAALVSFLLSYVLLRRQREAVAVSVAGRIERRLARVKEPDAVHRQSPLRLNDGAADEDAALDRSAHDQAAGEQ